MCRLRSRQSETVGTKSSGVLDSRGSLIGGETAPLATVEEVSPGVHRFSGTIECRLCGRQGFLVRVLPCHNVLGPIYEAGMLVWG